MHDAGRAGGIHLHGTGFGIGHGVLFFGTLILQLEELHLCASRGDGKEEYTDTSHRYPRN